MWQSIIANSERFYPNCTYNRMENTRVTGGKVEKSLTAAYEQCPIAFVGTSKGANWTDDGILKRGSAKAYIPNRFFELHEFSPSLEDILIRDGVTYRITDIKDYSYHPHIGVYAMTLKRIEYHG